MNDSSTTVTDDNQMATNESTFNGLEPSSRKRKLSMGEMSSSRVEIEILKSAIEKWKQYAQKLEAEKIQHIKDGCNEGKVKVMELEDTVSKLQTTNAELCAKNEEENNQHQAAMDLVISEYTAKIHVLQAEKKQAESKIKELTDEILSIKRIKSEINDSAETERETHQTEIHTLKDENSELKKQIQAYEDEKQKSVEKILELINQASSLETKKKQNVRQSTVKNVGKKKAVTPRVDMVTIMLQIMTHPGFRVIKMKTNDRFDQIYLDYSAETGLKPEDLLLLWHTGFEHKNVKYFDTPAKLKMPLNDSVILFFEPRQGAQREIRGDGEIKIKINTRIHKEPLERLIHKEMPFGEFKAKLCAELKIKPSQVQFKFDGEKVYDDDTPADLDMEDYDCIDMYF